MAGFVRSWDVRTSWCIQECGRLLSRPLHEPLALGLEVLAVVCDEQKWSALLPHREHDTTSERFGIFAFHFSVELDNSCSRSVVTARAGRRGAATSLGAPFYGRQSDDLVRPTGAPAQDQVLDPCVSISAMRLSSSSRASSNSTAEWSSESEPAAD